MTRAMLALAIVAGTLAVVLIYSSAALPLAVWHLLVDGGILIAWLLAAEGIGRQLLRLFRIDRSNVHPSLMLATAIALGLGTMSLLILVLGLAGLLNQLTSIALLLIGCALGLPRWIPLLRRPLPRDTGFQPVRSDPHRQDAHVTNAPPKQLGNAGWNWLLVLIVPFAGIMIAGALIPPGFLWSADDPVGYDVTEYHLQIPREWYESGRILPLHHNVYSYFPFNVEMHYLLAMHLRAGPWNGMYLAQLMHAAMIALTFLAIYGAARLFTVPLLASIATLGAVVTPWTIMLGSVAYDEGGLLLFGTLAIAWTLHWLRSEQPLRTIAIAGVFAGLACGSKLTAVPIVLIAIPITLLPRWRAASIFLLACLFAFAPWLTRNQVWAHNPLFPEAMSLFGRSHFSERQQQRWQKAHAPRPDQQSLLARLDAFWRQILIDWRYASVLLPLALIAAALTAFSPSPGTPGEGRGEGRPSIPEKLRTPHSTALLKLLLLLALFWLFATHLQSRFFVLAIPLACLLIAQVRWKWWPLFAATFLFVAAIASWLQLNHRFTPFTVAIGAEDTDSILFVLSHPPDGTDQALHTAQPIVLVGDAQAFWYRTPHLRYRTVFDVDNSTEKGVIPDWIGPAPLTPDTIILVYPSELTRFHNTYYAIPQLPPQLQFSPPFRLAVSDLPR